MTKTKPKTKKTDDTTSDVGAKARRLKSERYKSFRLQKRIKTGPVPKMTGGLRLMRETFGLLRANWKTFLGVSLIYAAANQLLVQGLLGFDTNAAKQALQNAWTGGIGSLGSGFDVAASLFGGNGLVSDVASVYQFILLLVATLAFIWTFRHASRGEKVRVRDGFYRGMTPLIPFLLVYLVVAIQLLPVALGTYLYNSAGPGFAVVNGVEVMIWVVALGLLAMISLYMLSSSVFALYIVSLPGATPIASLRAARKLVYGKRLMIIRRFLVLPIVVLLFGAALLLPAIMISSVLAVIIFFILNAMLLPIIHGFMFGLYQELLRETE
jgi:hypothetical protein